MAQQLFANNASSTLASGISASDLSMTVVSGAAFPSLAANYFFFATLVGTTSGAETSWEIVKVTARATNVLTIVRAQQSTAAAIWAIGTKVELRLTTGFLDSPIFTTPNLGIPQYLLGTNITGTASSLMAGVAQALRSATTTVSVVAALEPSNGQVLTATSSTTATWQTPSGGGGGGVTGFEQTFLLMGA